MPVYVSITLGIKWLWHRLCFVVKSLQCFQYQCFVENSKDRQISVIFLSYCTMVCLCSVVRRPPFSLRALSFVLNTQLTVGSAISKQRTNTVHSCIIWLDSTILSQFLNLPHHNENHILILCSWIDRKLVSALITRTVELTVICNIYRIYNETTQVLYLCCEFLCIKISSCC